MKTGSRYKILGKKKFAALPRPVSEVKEKLDQAVNDRSRETNYVCNYIEKTGLYKFFYKISQKRGDLYESYCLLSDLKAVDENSTKIEYAFVFDRYIYLYTKILSALCFIIPIVIAIIAALFYKTTSLFIMIPLAVVALFGLCSFFVFKEKRESVEPLIDEFQNLLVSLFDESEQTKKEEPNDSFSVSDDTTD